MTSTLPPLGGALLITNPAPRALALENSNVRRRINKAARYAIKKGVSPEAAFDALRSGKLQRTRGDGKAAMKHIASGAARKQSPAEKKAYAAAKRKITRLMSDSYGLTGKGFIKRARQGKGKQYTSGKTSQKTSKVFGKSRTYKVLDAGKSRAASARRGEARRVSPSGTISGADLAALIAGGFSGTGGLIRSQKRARYTHPTLDVWSGVGPAKAGYTLMKSAIHRSGGEAWSKKPRKPAKGKAKRSARKSDKRSASARARYKGSALDQFNQAARVYAGQHGVSMKQARKALKGTHARANGSALIPLGALALENPFFGISPVQMAMGIGTAAAVSAGGLMAARFVAPKAVEWYGKVPVVGPYLEENSLLTTGVLLSLIPALLGGVAGVRIGGDAGKAIAGISAAAAVMPLALFLADKAAEVSGIGDLGGLALENGLGGLALDNVSALGDLSDGMAYQVAPLTASAEQVDFGQASLADAFYSGADFSADEGQALMNGEFVGRYGAPPRRMGGGKVGASHLAGRPGHRWGWLVKMVGMDRARAICALPPKERVKMLAKLRAAAIKTFQDSSAADSVDSAASMAAAQASGPSDVSGFSSAQGAGGAHGAGELGATLFMGE